MKRILQYLTWLGDSAIEKGTVLYTLAKAAITAIDEFNGNVDAMTDQIYLRTATGEYLDRWGWDLVRLKRKYMEDDDSFRGRIIVEMLRLYGTRQAIIQAIMKCCTSLEIQVSAMGVATPEEWMWLESAGIEMFQGDLFSKAKLNGIPSVAWPEKK